MITLTARCPHCERTIRTALETGKRLDCPSCQKTISEPCPDFEVDVQSVRCATCPSKELFVRKDFPQRLGVAIVVAGFVASTFAWYHHRIVLTFAILFGTALIDVALYLMMKSVLQCYRCHAQYRGISSVEQHAGFDLETHERYRQQAARMQDVAAAPLTHANEPALPPRPGP